MAEGIFRHDPVLVQPLRVFPPSNADAKGLVFSCSGYCGLIDSGADPGGTEEHEDHWEFATANVSIVATAGPGSRPAYRYNPTAAQAQMRRFMVETELAGGFRLRVDTLPASTISIAEISNANGNGRIYLTAAGALQVEVGASARTTFGTVSADASWHWIDFQWDATTGTASLKAKLDAGTEQTQTNAQTSIASTDWHQGFQTSATGDIYITDTVLTNDQTLYPLGKQKVAGQWPDSDGTHDFATGDFKYDNTTNISPSATDVHTYLSDTGIDTGSDFISANTNNRSGYVEVGFANSGLSTDVLGVTVVMGLHSAGLSTNSIRVVANDGGSLALITQPFVDGFQDVSATGIVTVERVLSVPPSGGAWTAAKVDGLKIRFGYSDGSGSVPFLDSVLLEVPYEDTAVTPVERTTTDAPTTADAATRAGGFARATTDAPVLAESLVRAISAIRIAAKPLARDAFGRSASNGWGTADLGGAYSTTGGTLADYSVSGGTGRHNQTAVSTVMHTHLAISEIESETRVKVRSDKLAVGASQFVYTTPRKNGNDHYRFSFEFTTAQAVKVAIATFVSSVSTDIFTPTVIGRETHAANTFFNIRTQVTGTNPTTLRAKIWREGTSEPAGWDAEVTDSNATLQAAGGEGFRTFLGGATSNTPVLFEWDELSTVDFSESIGLSDVATVSKTVARTATDSITVSAAPVRVITSVRTTTDAVTLTSPATRAITAVRTSTDAPTTSDTAVAVKTTARSTADAPTVSESLTRTGTFSRATTDAPTTADTAVRASGFLRATTEAPTVAESVVRSITITRATTEAVTASAAPVRVVSAPRTVTQTVTVSEAVTRSAVLTRTTTDAPATSDVATRVITSTRAISDANLLVDQFDRTSASSWGTSTSGDAWTNSGGSAANFNVSDGVGTIAIAAVNSPRAVVAESETDARIVFRFRFDQIPLTAGFEVHAALRRIDASNYYRATVLINPDATVEIGLHKVVIGATTTVQASTSVGTGFTANDWWWVEFEAVSTGLRARVWEDGTSVPAWQREATDSSLLTAGAVGIRTQVNTGATNSLPVTLGISSLAAVELGDSIARTQVLSRTTSESPTVSESVTRTGSFSRATSDAPTTSDSAARVISKLNGTTDFPTTSDVATRTGGFIRAATEAPSITVTASRSVGANRTTTESVTAAAVATRNIVTTRAASEAVVLADVATRTGSFSRAVTQTVTASESVTRSQLLSRSASESVSTSESAVRSGTFSRSTTDAVTASAAPVQIKTTSRTTSESVTLSESATRTGSFSRSTTDAPTTADTASTTATKPRSTTDAVTIGLTAVRTLAAARSTTDAPTTADAATRQVAYTRTASDTVSTTDSIANPRSVSRTTTDAPTTSDAATRTGTFSRSTTEAVTASATPIATFNRGRTTTRSVTTSDVATRTGTFSRATTEAVTASDVATQFKVSGYSRTASDSPDLTENVTRTGTFSRSVTQTVTASDAATRQQAHVRTASDTTSVTTSVTGTLITLRSSSDGPTLSDSATRQLAATRTASDTTSVTDSVNRTASLQRSTTDAPVIAVTANRSVAYYRTASDSVITTESVGFIFTPGGVSYTRTATDTISTSESIAHQGIFTRRPTETASVTDSVSRTLVTSRTATDTVSGSDSVLASTATVITATDTTTTTDSIFVERTAGRTPTDTTTVSDSIATQGVFTRTVTDAVSTSDTVLPKRRLQITEQISSTLSADTIYATLFVDHSSSELTVVDGPDPIGSVLDPVDPVGSGIEADLVSSTITV